MLPKGVSNRINSKIVGSQFKTLSTYWLMQKSQYDSNKVTIEDVWRFKQNKEKDIEEQHIEDVYSKNLIQNNLENAISISTSLVSKFKGLKI